MNVVRRIRNDGFMNLMSGLNAPGLDRSSATFQFNHKIHNYHRRSNYNYAALYLTNGIAQKIIDRPADDAFQRGITIEEDEEAAMSNEFDRLQLLAVMADAVRWSRLSGGSALLLIAKDGGEFVDPLNLDSLDTVEEVKAIDINCVRGTDKFYTDPNDPTTYGKMEFYTISLPGVSSFDVHETRLIPMGGEPIPYGYVFANRIYWAGRSVLEGCYDDISRYCQGLEWSLRLLERKQQAVYSMAGLGDMFAQGDDAIVKERINLVDLVRGNLNSVVIDKEDTYVIQTPGMEGVENAIQEYMTAVAASSNIPVTILFGKPQHGLNQTGAGDLEAYYGMVSHIQNVIARPPLEKIVSILWLQKNLKGNVPESWKVTFNPLWVPDEATIAQANLNSKQADAAEVTMLISLMQEQILAPEEVRQIVVAKYPDFEFSVEIPAGLGAIDYSEGVDTSELDVPGDPPPGGNANA